MSTKRKSTEAALDTLGVKTANAPVEAEAVTYRQAFRMLDRESDTDEQLRGEDREALKDAVMESLTRDYRLSNTAKDHIDRVLEHTEYRAEEASEILDRLAGGATEQEALERSDYGISRGVTG